MKKFYIYSLFLCFITSPLLKAQQTDTVNVSSFDSVFAPLVQHSATGFIFDHIVLNVDPALIDGENAELMPLNASEFKQLLLKIQKVSF